jgi:hypothetical protein
MDVLKRYLEEALGKEEYIIEGRRSISQFVAGKYINYKFGDPSTAAIYISRALDRLEEVLPQARKVAGDAIWPAIKKELEKDIKDIIGKVK